MHTRRGGHENNPRVAGPSSCIRFLTTTGIGEKGNHDPPEKPAASSVGRAARATCGRRVAEVKHRQRHATANEASSACLWTHARTHAAAPDWRHCLCRRCHVAGTPRCCVGPRRRASCLLAWSPPHAAPSDGGIGGGRARCTSGLPPVLGVGAWSGRAHTSFVLSLSFFPCRLVHRVRAYLRHARLLRVRSLQVSYHYVRPPLLLAPLFFGLLDGGTWVSIYVLHGAVQFSLSLYLSHES